MCNFKPLLCFIGTNFGPSVLFTHYLVHLFSPVLGRSEEPNMGLPILGSQYLVNYSFGVIQCYRRLEVKKKWDPERMKAATEAMRNREMGRYRASRVFNLPQAPLQSYVKARECSSETVRQKWVGSKFFLVKEKMIWLSTVFWWKECFWGWQ